MLRSILTTGVLLFGILASSLVGAQVPQSSSTGAPLSAEDRARFEALTRELQQQAARAAADPQVQVDVSAAARRIDSIANPEMAAERAKVLRFLGIEPDKEHALFIFVSWSMPLDVLRAYAVEAMWTGSTLVFRGIPKGRTIPDFFLKDLRQLIWDKGAAAAISIDPRLFDAYGIEVVPSIVLSRDIDNPACVNAGERRVKAASGRVGVYKLCPPVRADEFVKMAGSVTLDFALEAFQSKGFGEAQMYLTALRKATPPGHQAPREQRAFKGEWNDVLGPLMEKAAAQSTGPESTTR